MSRIPPPPPATATLPGLIAALHRVAEGLPDAHAQVCRTAAAQLHLFGERLRPPPTDDGAVHLVAESGVSARDQQPMVQLGAFGHLVQLAPVDARRFALTILDACAASEIDAALYTLLTREIDLDPVQAAAILARLRAGREDA